MRATIAVALIFAAGCGRLDFDATTDQAQLADAAPDTPASQPVARIQSAAAPCCGGGAAESLALASNVSAGSTIVVLIGWFSTAPAVTASIASLADTLGNAYTLVPSSYALETGVVGYGNGNFYSEIGFATNSAPGADTISFTLSASVTKSTSIGTGLGAGPGWTMASNGIAMAIFGQEYVVQTVAGSLTGDFDGMGGAGQWMASMAAFKSI